MFQSIIYNNNGTWTVIDTDFAPTVTLWSGVHGIIYVYNLLYMDPTPALKKYFEIHINKKDRLPMLNANNNNILGKPSINKYYLCLKRHLEKLNYIGK